MIDNTTAYCGTHNCLTPIGGTLALSEIKAGPDGTVYGLTSAHALYTYTQPTGWVLAPAALQSPGGGSITHISVESASQVLGLNNAAAPAANVYVLDSAGTAWAALTGAPTLAVAEIGSDGSIWGLTSGNVIYNFNGSVWTQVSGTLSNLANAGMGNVWGVNPSGVIQQWNGTAFAALSPTPSFTPSQATDAIATAGGGGLAILDTSGGIHVSSNAGSTWKTVKGTATAIAGAGGASMFALNGSASYHLNLLVQQLGVKATGNWACPFTWVAGGPQIACNSSVTNTMTAIAKFGGAGGNHGTGGYTGTNVVAMTGPTNPQTVSAWEQAGLCDLFDAPGAPECTPLLGGGVTNSQVGLLQAAASPGLLPDWIVPPVAPAPGESLYWWPLTGAPVLYAGSDQPYYSASGGNTAVTLTKDIGHNPAFEQSPSASWPPVSAPPVQSADITRIYGVTRGSFNGIGGISYIGQGPYPGGSINFVGNFSAWSGVAYSSLAPSSYFDPHSFPWTAYNPVMSIPDSVYWSGTSTFITSDIGFLLYVVMLAKPEISGPHTVWWFNGKNPNASAYPISVTLTSTAGSSTSWSVSQADAKVSLSSTTGTQITITSTGTHFSKKIGDITITAKANGAASDPFTMTAKTPWKLVFRSRNTYCNPSPETYGTEISYDLIDNLSTTLSSDIFWNESVGSETCENGSNWCKYAIQTSSGSTDPLIDILAPPNLNIGAVPTPTCTGQESGTTRYRSIPQVIYVGSDSSGGVQAQSDTLGYYIDHGQHDSIQSPTQPPQ